MKIFTTAGFKYCMTVLAIVFLSACAVKKYSYEKPDAGTVYLSMTSNSTWSREVVEWSIDFEALDENARKERPLFGTSQSTRNIGRRNVEDLYQIFGMNQFGNIHQSTKLHPGRYRVRFISSVKSFASNGMPAGANIIFHPINGDLHKKYPSKEGEPNTNVFPNAEFTIEPGKAIYLGSFNAARPGCKDNLTNQGCEKFQIVIRDEFKRDSQLLKEQLAKRPQDPNFEFINRVLKIDRNASPYFFSE